MQTFQDFPFYKCCSVPEGSLNTLPEKSIRRLTSSYLVWVTDAFSEVCVFLCPLLQLGQKAEKSHRQSCE